MELRLNSLIACQKRKASLQGSPVERAQDPGHRRAVIAELKEPAELWSGKLPADSGLVEQLVETLISRGPRPYAFESAIDHRRQLLGLIDVPFPVQPVSNHGNRPIQ